jgi:hypothetical protein
MGQKIIAVHVDHSNQEIRKVVAENLTTVQINALSGVDLVAGKYVYNTTEKRLFIYDGTSWHKVVNAQDLNKFGVLIQSGLDASGGIPDGVTAGQIGSGVDSFGNPLTGTASIQAGDHWFISTPGTIVGISGDDNLSVGDFLWALQDNPTLASHFAGVNMNVNDASLGTIKSVLKTSPVVAGVALSFAAEMAASVPALTEINSIMVVDNATGEEINVLVNRTAKTIYSNSAIASVTIYVIGK